MSKQWNPRYVEFARASGRGPQEQLDHDRAESGDRGGVMTDFILWMGARLREFRADRGYARFRSLTREDHDDLSAWLVRYVDERKHT